MPLAVFEPAIPASERPQTHALDRAATGTGHLAGLVEDNKLIKSARIERLGEGGGIDRKLISVHFSSAP